MRPVKKQYIMYVAVPGIELSVTVSHSDSLSVTALTRGVGALFAVLVTAILLCNV